MSIVLHLQFNDMAVLGHDGLMEKELLQFSRIMHTHYDDRFDKSRFVIYQWMTEFYGGHDGVVGII